MDTIQSGKLVDKYMEAVEYVAEITIEGNQYDPAKLWEEAQKMGLEMGDLEEYGFTRSSLCGNGLCAPNLTREEFVKKQNMAIDRFIASMQKQYEVAMCHPYVAQYRP